MPRPCNPSRQWPYLPVDTQRLKLIAAQYRAKAPTDPLQPTAVLKGGHLTRCPKCARLMERRELWRHRC